jgi:hypothetical protein
MPPEWDEDEDGEWEAPEISNPAFTGEWKAKQVENPDYKGVWKPAQLDNPSYFEESNPFSKMVRGAQILLLSAFYWYCVVFLRCRMERSLMRTCQCASRVVAPAVSLGCVLTFSDTLFASPYTLHVTMHSIIPYYM